MTLPRVLGVVCPGWGATATGLPPEVPVAVLEANRVVVAVSPGASAQGVSAGLRRREAQARCPELVVVRRDVGRETRCFEPVVVALEELGARVEVRYPGCCFMPTRGPSRYFGGDEALARRVAMVVARAVGTAPSEQVGTARSEGGLTGERWGVGMADGVFAARLAASCGVVVPPGESAPFLSVFPVATLDRPELADLLGRLGVRTLGQLAALPEADVVTRFGEEGALAWRLARGDDGSPVRGRKPPPDLAVAFEPDPPIDSLDRAAFATRRMAEELHSRLTGLGLSCTSVVVDVSTASGERLSRLWSHDRAFEPETLAERARWQLEAWISGASPSPTGRPRADVVRIALVAEEVSVGLGRQAGFWGGEAQVSGRVARSTARLQGLLGPSGVIKAVPGGGRSPGEQVELVPWGDPSPSFTGAPWPGRLPSPSPALVHPERALVEVVDERGDPVRVTGRGVASGLPARLSVDGSPWMSVVASSGPWPADERWWDDKSRRRQARIQVVVSDGSAHLLSLEGSRWGLEATYG